MRGGTENVAWNRRSRGRLPDRGPPPRRRRERERLEGLRERLWAGLAAAVPGIRRTSARVPTLPNTLHVRFPSVTGNAILDHAPGDRGLDRVGLPCGKRRAPAAILALGASAGRRDRVGPIEPGPGNRSGVDRSRDRPARRGLARGSWRESKRRRAIVQRGPRRNRRPVRTPSSSGGRWPGTRPPSRGWSCVTTATCSGSSGGSPEASRTRRI